MGRVAREKLTKATQLRLEAVKESKQRSNFNAAIFFGPIFVFNQGTELVFAGFLSLVESLLSFGQSSRLWSEPPDFLVLLLLSHVFSLVLFDE